MLFLRLARIFARYAETHLALFGPDMVLRGASGAVLGHLEHFYVHGGRMILKGKSSADYIILVLGASEHRLVPNDSPGAGEGAFHFDVPFEVGPLSLVSGVDGLQHDHVLTGFRPAQVTTARLWLLLQFLWALICLLPQIWRWKTRGDFGAREEVKEALGLLLRPAARYIDPHVLVGSSEAQNGQKSDGAITIVMPVFNAFDDLQEALDRVVRHTDLPWHLVLIEDASTDPRVRSWLTDWSLGQGDTVTLLKNDRNLGFVGSVNRGLAEAMQRRSGDPVVLLNTDAMVPAGWAGRLLAPLADPNVASVTPLSNDAEIFTAPFICEPYDIEAGQGDALDRLARGLGAGNPRPTAPTGVGFCIALAPHFLEHIPQFDATFGRGYGEETDWCQKIRAFGGVHVCAQNLFVEHRGGASFGSLAKQVLLGKSAAEIARRYPRYDAEVMEFVKADPLSTPRLAMAMSWAALLGEEVPVYLAHAMGGGAEHWLEQCIAEHIAQGGCAVVLRVGQAARWRLEVHTCHGMIAGLSEDLTVIQTLIERLPRRRIVYSCGVGDRRPHELPQTLLQLAGQAHEIVVLVHDFFMISPSFTLLGQDNTFAGVPLAGQPGPTNDPAHQFQCLDGDSVTLTTWQQEWGRLVARASQVIAFSDDSRTHVAAAYPDSAGKIIVVPHRIAGDVPRIKQNRANHIIGVLGNIGPQKGAAVIQRLSENLAQTSDPKAQIVVLGHLAPEYRLTRPSLVHGAYRLEDLPGLVARYGISGWFIPSIWPETFSFTTHEALATGLPVLAFDLGAQSEAVKTAQNGAVLNPDAAKAADLGDQIIKGFERLAMTDG